MNIIKVPVWDPLLRILHWALLLTVAVSWFTRHGFGVIHEWWGYGALVVVLARVIWGFTGPAHARFRHFLRRPATTIEYFRRMLKGQSRRYLGHNPMGGWATVVLLTLVFLVCASGWLYTTDRFWGIAWVETMHWFLTQVLGFFVGLHLLGVLFASLKNRENLPAAMIHGRKRAPKDQDIS